MTPFSYCTTAEANTIARASPIHISAGVEDVSGEIGRPRQRSLKPWRLKIDIFGTWHGQRIGQRLRAGIAGEPLVVFERDQNVCRTASVRDENGAILGRFFRTARVLVELAT